MDKIKLRRLRFFGRHGVLPEERKLGQTFFVSAVLEMESDRSGTTDDLSHGTDYRRAVECVAAVMTGKPVRLLETLAETIAQRLLETCADVENVVVEVEKPDPPIETPSDGISVEIRRGRRKNG